MRKAIFTALVLLMLCVGLGCGVTPFSPDVGQSIWTDKADYDPGEVVTVYGAGFSQGPVTLIVTRPDGEINQIPDVSADSSGSFTASYPLNGIMGTYIVNATDSVGQTAQMTFTDGATGVSVGAQVGTLTYGTAGSVTYTITVWGSGKADVSLSISALPAGTGATFDPSLIQGETSQWPTKTSTLTVYTTDTAPAGTYAFTVHAGGHDASGTLTIGAGCTIYYKDADGDSYGLTSDSKYLCAPEDDYTATLYGDCDDNDANEHPGQTWYRDADDDGYSDGATDTTSCTRPAGYKVASELTATSGDCDDNDANEHPGQTWYKDADDDGYSDGETDTTSCTRPAGYKVASELTATSGDCNEADANEHPGQTWYKDADDDGYSDGTTDTTSCTRPPGYKLASELISTSGDNDDNDAEVNPGATEVPYNGKDDDCNPATPDDDLDQDGYPIATDCDDNDTNEHPGQTWYRDADDDGYSDGATDTTSCTRPAGYKVASELTATSGDNDDSDAEVNPGATEVPYNGKDDDCNPATPDDDLDQDGYPIATDCDDADANEHPGQTWYKDADDDGYSYGTTNTISCNRPLGYKVASELTATSGDCDDADANEHPGQTWYKDADGDGYSDGTTDTTSCTRPPVYKVASELTATSGDCNDADANEHPGQTWYKDADDDGYSDGTTDTISCTRPTGYKLASELISTSGDNDDNDAEVNPGATEVPYNGKDDDCNPATPDDDLDQDGYPIATDCDDNDVAVNPGATEVPYNGKDDDCNPDTIDGEVPPPTNTGGDTTTPGGDTTTPEGSEDTTIIPPPTGGRPPRVVRGCFIATAAYGTTSAEQIDLLREFRDMVLLESNVGSQFVDLYYQLSPPIADIIAGNKLWKNVVRELLVDPIVWVVDITGDLWRN